MEVSFLYYGQNTQKDLVALWKSFKMDREIVKTVARMNHEADASIVKYGVRNEISIKELDYLFQENFLRTDDNYFDKTVNLVDKSVTNSDENNKSEHYEHSESELNNNIVQVTKVLTPIAKPPTFEVAKKPLPVSCISLNKKRLPTGNSINIHCT